MSATSSSPRSWPRRDAEIDRLNREIPRRAVAIGDDLDLREWAIFMTLVARALERIGDNAVDIAEQTMFVVTGLFRELADASSGSVGDLRGSLNGACERAAGELRRAA